jgi:phospholipid/cholesterol/gamma-HCH transport system substrate-binding protein
MSSSSRTVLQLRRYGRSFLILLTLMVVGLAAGFYILIQQRLPNPFSTFYEVKAAFPSAAAVVPGLGEPVDVAGVHVGEIMNTTLKNGQGIITMEIDPNDGVRHLYRNATATLTPQTPLDNMYVDIYPGTPSAGILKRGATIPVSETTSPTQFQQLLDQLDTPTRQWFTTLIAETANATSGQGVNLRRLFDSLGPTAQQLHTIDTLLVQRREEISQSIHNLAILTSATSRDDSQLGELVDAGNTAIHALASQDSQLASSIGQLPSTLAATRRTFTDLTPFARQLGPTSNALEPVVRDFPTTLRDIRTLVKGAAILPPSKVRAFESAADPLGPTLASLDGQLHRTVPNLIDSFKLLRYVTDEFAYDPGHGNPGFLYWFAYFANNVDSFLGNTDANGPAWRTLTIVSCSSLDTFSFGPLLEDLLGTNFGCST